MLLWRTLTKSLVEFCKAVASKSESQLFEMFLKFEVEREKANPQKDQITSKLYSVILGLCVIIYVCTNSWTPLS